MGKSSLFTGFSKKQKKKHRDKKENIQGIWQEGIKLSSESGKRLAISCVVALMLFGICLVLVKKMAAEEEKVSVLMVKQHVSANMKIDEWGNYFEMADIPVSLVPETSIQNPDQLRGKFTLCSLEKNQILTTNLLTEKEDWKGENLIEVSIGVNSIAQMVGGTVREGDYVNVCSIKETSEFSEGGSNVRGHDNVPIMEKVYVTQTFTSSGAVVPSQDRVQAVTVINILIPAEEEARFNTELSAGTLRISRICN